MTECETVLYSKQFDKLLTNCFTTGMWLWAIAELTERTHSHLGIGKRKKTERTNGREGYGDWVWSGCSH